MYTRGRKRQRAVLQSISFVARSTYDSVQETTFPRWKRRWKYSRGVDSLPRQDLQKFLLAINGSRYINERSTIPASVPTTVSLVPLRVIVTSPSVCTETVYLSVYDSRTWPDADISFRGKRIISIPLKRSGFHVRPRDRSLGTTRAVERRLPFIFR